MQVFNFRNSFANNSSSTHSTLLNLNGRKLEEILPSYLSCNDIGQYSGASYGWEEFVLTSKEEKDLYLAAQIWENLSNWRMGIPAEARIGFIEQVIPELRGKLKADGEYGIDHQSVWDLPKDCGVMNPQFPSVEFIKDLRKYLQKPEVVILGGNDNGGDDEDGITRFGLEESAIGYLPTDLGYSNWTCRKDDDVWLLFDSERGQRIRFSFKDDVKNENSEIPELVDLIITNHCKTNCDFCYRGCTNGGWQANISKVRSMIGTLLEWGVPEIVIGGGDILLYDSLDRLCKLIRYWRKEYNVAINTTINPRIEGGSKIEGDFRKKLDLIAESFNSIALSGISRDTFFVYDYFQLTSRVSVSIQIIPELILHNEYEVEQLLNFIKDKQVKITLLGLKNTGRMLDYTTKKYNMKNIEDSTKKISDFVKKLEDSECYLGMDTAFLQKFKNIAEKYDRRTWFDQEGKFSCCIDMATSDTPTMSKSSYQGEAHKIENCYKDELQKAWDKVRKE